MCCALLFSMSADRKHVATRQSIKAIALKKQLTALANEQPAGDKQVDYGHLNRLAEWPVFFAYARLVGPVCVYSVPAASVATLYSFVGEAGTDGSADPEPCVYLYHNNAHFQRLAPAIAADEAGR